MGEAAGWRTRARVAPPVLAGAVLLQLLALGANDGLLAIVAAAVNVLAAAAVLMLLPPSAGLWARAWPVLIVVALLLLAIALPTLPRGWPLAALLAEARDARMVPELGGGATARAIGAAALLLAAALTGYRRGLVVATVGWLAAAGGMDLLVGLVLRAIDPLSVWGQPKGINAYRFTGTMVNANASGCVFTVTALLAAGRLQGLLADRGGWPVRGIPLAAAAALAATCILALGGCALTGSRTALLCAAAGLALLGWRGRDLPGLRTARGRAALAGLAACAALLLLLFGWATIDRLGTLSADGADRVAIWSRYLYFAGGAPPFGFGAGGFVELNARFMRDPADALLFYQIRSAHNVLLAILIDYGWIGLALTLAAAGLIAASVARNERHAAYNPVSTAVVAALAVILLCASVDIALDVPAIMSATMLLVGLVWGRALRTAADRASARRGARPRLDPRAEGADQPPLTG